MVTPNATAACQGRRGASVTSSPSAATSSAAAGMSVPTTLLIATPAGQNA